MAEVKSKEAVEAMEVADRVLCMNTAGEIRGFLTRRIRQIWPSVSLLDVKK